MEGTGSGPDRTRRAGDGHGVGGAAGSGGAIPETLVADFLGGTDCTPCRPQGGIASSARRVTERAEWQKR
jgi:hypothetical protein